MDVQEQMGLKKATQPILLSNFGCDSASPSSSVLIHNMDLTAVYPGFGEGCNETLDMKAPWK